MVSLKTEYVGTVNLSKEVNVLCPICGESLEKPCCQVCPNCKRKVMPLVIPMNK